VSVLSLGEALNKNGKTQCQRGYQAKSAQKKPDAKNDEN
jgi:hypothetical protein